MLIGVEGTTPSGKRTSVIMITTGDPTRYMIRPRLGRTPALLL